jgi:hypothetical protein
MAVIASIDCGLFRLAADQCHRTTPSKLQLKISEPGYSMMSASRKSITFATMRTATSFVIEATAIHKRSEMNKH